MHRKARFLAVSFMLVFCQFYGICQNQPDGCGEKPGAPQKVFVFIGELLSAKKVFAREHYNEARYSATYRIIERVCGDYSGPDTMDIDVIQVIYDSSFKRHKFQLLMLTKDTSEGEDYVLWADLYFDLFKTRSNEWAGSYMSKNDTEYEGRKALKPKKVGFSKQSFYDTRGMTREEIDLFYPEPFYKIKREKAIPVLGNSIQEIFQHQKEGTLANADIYELPQLPEDPDHRGVVVQELQLEEIGPDENDSINLELELVYLRIRDSLAKDPFNEGTIRRLMDNCRGRGDYSLCSTFLDTLMQLYPDLASSYILNAKFGRPRASLEDSSRIGLLKRAVNIDSSNYETNYDLAVSYYRLFRQQPSPYYAFNARYRFMRCIDIDSAQGPLLKYAVIQLSNYLNDSTGISMYRKYRYHVRTKGQGIPLANERNWYFPIEPFLDDHTDCVNDYSIDIVAKLGLAEFRLDWFSSALARFNEPVLSNGYKGKAYRLLWLRSFHEPVVIRMHKAAREVTIHWKVLRYNDSDASHSVLEHEKKIPLKHWKKFEKMLASIDYWSMISQDYMSNATDGAVWLLEAAIDGKYKITKRSGYIYLKYTKCLRYLIDVADLSIPEDEIY